MTIKEIEELSGMPRANIRFYEAEGLLRPDRDANGYRNYSEEDLRILQKIRLLRALHVSLEDIPVLSGIYPVVGIDDAYLEYSMLRGLPESMLDTISHGLSAAGATSLITWMEYDNNSISGSPVLTMAIPDLNASLSIMDQSAAGRIEESLGIIRDEYIAAGSDAVFGETAHYGLYGDGLVRIERQ